MTDSSGGRGLRWHYRQLRDNFYLVQVQLTETPSADWKRLFLRCAAIATRLNFHREP